VLAEYCNRKKNTTKLLIATARTKLEKEETRRNYDFSHDQKREFALFFIAVLSGVVYISESH
jgi:hypothetical protein